MFIPPNPFLFPRLQHGGPVNPWCCHTATLKKSLDFHFSIVPFNLILSNVHFYFFIQGAALFFNIYVQFTGVMYIYILYKGGKYQIDAVLLPLQRRGRKVQSAEKTVSEELIHRPRAECYYLSFSPQTRF